MMDIVFIALGLFMVFEGIMPTIAPETYQRMMALVSQLPASSLRKVGLVMIGIGTLIIFIAKS